MNKKKEIENRKVRKKEIISFNCKNSEILIMSAIFAGCEINGHNQMNK